MCWKIEKEIYGSLPRIRVFIFTMGNPSPQERQVFSILQQRMDLPLIQRCIFMRTEPVISGLEQTDTMERRFEILPQKMDFPVTAFVYSLKTKPAGFGLVHKGKICSFVMAVPI